MVLADKYDMCLSKKAIFHPQSTLCELNKYTRFTVLQPEQK